MPDESDLEHYVVEYSLDGGHTWNHGRTIQNWVYDDLDALRDQREAVRDNVRETYGNIEGVAIRVLSENDPKGALHQPPEPDTQVWVFMKGQFNEGGQIVDLYMDKDLAFEDFRKQIQDAEDRFGDADGLRSRGGDDGSVFFTAGSEWYHLYPRAVRTRNAVTA